MKTIPAIKDVLCERIMGYYRAVDKSTNVSQYDGTFLINPECIETIMGLFAPNAVYDRKTIQKGIAKPLQTFKNHEAIKHFLDKERFLNGTHDIKHIHATPGVDPAIRGLYKSHFPAQDSDTYKTVKATGIFTGVLAHTDALSHQVNTASSISLPFDDYWVFAGEKAIYRYSKIMPPPEMAIKNKHPEYNQHTGRLRGIANPPSSSPKL